jgi:hypothetical protein
MARVNSGALPPSKSSSPTAVQFVVHDTPSSLLSVLLGPFGEGCTFQLVPFQWITTVLTGVSFSEAPTAVQELAEMHETAVRWTAGTENVFGLGVACTFQEVPFQRSARVFSPT